jgi:hypothetical protein
MSLLTLLDLEFGSALKRLQLLSEGVDEAGLHVSHWQLRVDRPRTVRVDDGELDVEQSGAAA